MRSSPTAAVRDPGITFTFPGQGSYSYSILRELYTSFPQASTHFQQAHEIGQELLRGDFLSLVTAASEKEHDERLAVSPDLDQIGIYLTEVLIAKLLIESGVRPALLVGHSFGELAALATAGAYSIETGLRIVCHRVLALQSMAQPGAMAAVSCDSEGAKRYLNELGNNSIEVSVINLPRQTVVSGKPSELEVLRNVLNRHGVSLTLLKSKYPYHSSFLASAVAPFRRALETFDFSPATLPVYLCMEGNLYSPGSNLPQILSSQFVRTLDFRTVVKTLYDSGYRTFIECGAGNIVTRLIGQNLVGNSPEIEAWAIASLDGSLRQGLGRLAELGFGKTGAKSGPSETVGISGTGKSAAQLLESMSLVLGDMSQLVSHTSQLVEQVAESLSRSAIAGSDVAEDSALVDERSVADVPPPQSPPSVTATASPNYLSGEKSAVANAGSNGTAVSGANRRNASSTRW